MNNEEAIMNNKSYCRFLFLLLAAFCVCAATSDRLLQFRAYGQSVVKTDKTLPGGSSIQVDSSGPNVIYIPGFLSGDDKQIHAKAIINQIFPDAKSVNHRPWCDKQWIFSQAVDASDMEAEKLASELAKWSESERNRLILIGHSLGGRVIIRTLHILNSKGIPIRQAILLGAALDNDDSQIEKALLASREKVISVVNPTDGGLKQYLKHGNSKMPALGTGYVMYNPERLREIQTDASEMHDSFFYLHCLLLNYNNEKQQNCIIVPQVEYNIPKWIDEQTLKNGKTEDCLHGWRLMSRKEGLWKNKTVYEIVDDLSFIRAKGSSLDDVKKSFDKVKKQLQDGLSDGEIASNHVFKEIKIKQFDAIVQKKGSSKELEWKTIRTIKGFDGWRLQQNGRSFRILDPAANVRSYIKKDKNNQMKKAFTELEIRLLGYE